MRRREFITLIGCAALSSPLQALAQPSQRMRRVGVLIPLAEGDAQARIEVAAFRERLQQLGWIEGRDLQIVTRWAAGDISAIRAYAKELVGLQPDAILARTTPVTAALLQETRTIPIVFVGASDPVGAGFAKSLARPGGNATGFTNVEASLGGKWVELLKEIIPNLTRIAVVFDPNTSPDRGSFYLRQVQDAARTIAVEAVATPVRDGATMELAIKEFAGRPNGGLVVTPDVTTHNNRTVIFSLAARYQLPAVYGYLFYVAEGGFAAYGIDTVDLYKQAAGYVDRILRGEKPDQLAIQAPTKLELAINLKTAKTLGITVPRTLISRADKVIE